jgi:uncharacterized membrane protein YdbT with pleckstrin-like domain
VSLNLAAGERVIFEGHPSWRAILAFYAKGLLLAIAAGLVVALGTRIFSDDANSGLVFAVVLVVLAVTVLIGFLKRVATTYTITDRRLHIKRGIISREVQETRLERVQNVNYNQSVIQRLLQIGDVDFDTAAGDDYNFVFSGVADPADVIHMVDRATGAASPDGLAGAEQPREPESPGR